MGEIKRITLCAMIILTLILVSTGGIMENAYGGDFGTVPIESDHGVFGSVVYSSPITVMNDTELGDLISSESWEGNGSADNPYLIANLSINAQGEDHGIRIENTRSHFIIHNCTIENATSTSQNATSAIHLNNVTNATLTENGINNVRNGIQIFGSGIFVLNNTITGASYNGIRGSGTGINITENHLIQCYYGLALNWIYGTDIAGNNITQGGMGLYINSGEYLNITDNFVNNNTDNGIFIIEVTNSLISDNLVSDNFRGMFIRNSDYNTIGGNRIFESDEEGIYLNDQSEWNQIMNNTISDNDEGIRTSYLCERNNISGNHISNNLDGIYSRYSFYNSISNNIISKNNQNGINLEGSRYSTVIGNELSGNVYHGLRIYNSFILTIEDNEISENRNGIDILSSHDLDITENSIHTNRNGIVMASVTDSNIINNSIHHSAGHGISLSSSDRNLLTGNNIYNNYIFGVQILAGKDNRVLGNALVYNQRSGDVYNNTFVQAFDDSFNNVWNGSGSGNYWRDWDDPDTNSDGIVELPYYILGSSNMDPFPLSKSPFPVVPKAPWEFNASAVQEMVSISWKEPEDSGSSDLLGYNIYRSEVPGGGMVVIPVSDDILNYQDTGVIAGKTYRYFIRARNSVGEGGRTEMIDVIPDDTVPVLTIEYPSYNDYISTNMITARFTAQDQVNGISHYLVKLDEGGWENIGNTTEYEFTDLPDGDHTISVRAVDPATNWMESSVYFTVDTMDPTVWLVNPLNNSYTNLRTFDIIWNGSDGVSGIDHFSYKLDSWNWIDVGKDTSRTAEYLIEGNHSIIVRAHDNAGNVKETSAHFQVDITPPVIDILEPNDGYRFTSDTLDIKWTASDARSPIDHYVVSIEGLFSEITQDRSYLLTDLPEGDHSIAVTVFDMAGNNRTDTVYVTIDTSSPSIIDHNPTGEEVLPDETISMVFSELMNRSATVCSVNGGSGYLVWSGMTAYISLDHELEYNMTYTVEIEGEDIAGNVMEIFSWTFTTTNSGRITGKIHDNFRRPMANVDIFVDGINIGKTGSDGEFSIKIESGEHDIRAFLEGFTEVEKTVVLDPGDDLDIGILILLETVDYGYVSGKVVDSGGKPLANVLVSLDTGETVQTDENGFFTLEGPVGTFNMTFFRTGYVNRYMWMEIRADETTTVDDLAMSRDENTPLPDGDPDDNNGTLINILMFLVVLIVGILLLAFLVIRKRSARKEYGEE